MSCAANPGRMRSLLARRSAMLAAAITAGATACALAAAAGAATLVVAAGGTDAAARTYAPYADGLTWRFHCTPTDGAAYDLTETFHARGRAGGLRIFGLSIARNGEAPVEQSVHGVDAAGNGYLVGTYANGTLRALPAPALTVPANPAPGFEVRFTRLDEQVVRRYVKEADVRNADGSTFRAVLFADETGSGTATYAYAPGLGLILSNTIPHDGNAVLCQRRS